MTEQPKPEQGKAPRVFVSYSWTSPDHENRILEWAEKLVTDGVDVILDKWHLKEGDDKYAFMEQMVTDVNVSKVLVFSDSGYATKADNRKGGVGTESQIISKEVYDKVKQGKFLPVVCEKDGSEEPCLPAFLKSRIYFDFSSPERFHEEYEKLVRAIFGKPLHKRPALGKPPEYILSPDKLTLWSKPLLDNFRDAVLQDRKSYQGHASAFLEVFAERLEEFRIKPEEGKEFDDKVVASIESFLPFRDHFVEFVRLVCVYRNEPEMYEQIAKFFERCVAYRFCPDKATAWGESWSDNYRFILCELFLYVVALLIKHGRLEALMEVTDRHYLLPDTAGAGNNSLRRFTIFRCHCRSLEHRNDRLKLARLSLIADLMKQRAALKSVTWSEIMQADAVLLLRSLLAETYGQLWIPQTLVYAGWSKTFELFARASSKREFERIKRFFAVSSKDELISKFERAIKNAGVDQWSQFVQSHVDLRELYGLDQLAMFE